MSTGDGLSIKESTKRNIKTFLKLEALFVPLYFSFVMYYTFLNAYFTPSEFNTMFINKFGEANFEFVLIPVCLLLSIAGAIIWMTEDMRKTRTVNGNVDVANGGENL